MSITLSNILEQLPIESQIDFRSKNQHLFKQKDKACIIIDDDPTGNQTVYDIPLLTTWDLNVFVTEFINKIPVFFVLTNSRSLSAEKTSQIYKEIADNIKKASELTKREFTIISRSDSTLRGHFPIEPATLRQQIYGNEAITIFIPVMFEGGRVTVKDIHYVLDKETLTPVNETPFAQDHSFSYSNADLKKYIEEKTKGCIEASCVYSFSIAAIRNQSAEELSEQIVSLLPNTYCIFNSLCYSDLDKVTNALLLAEQSGKKILYRTSSSFVPSYIGLHPKHLLQSIDLIKKAKNHGGLTIVGSYVKKSSNQLKKALSLFNNQTTIILDVEKVIKENSNKYLREIIKKIDHNTASGKDTLVYTSRKVITGKDAHVTIDIASRVSMALVNLVKGICVRPKYFIAKGGITSHDLAVKGLNMLRSKVIGQILPGVPVWEMSEQTKFYKLPYIVFPGNVGDNNALKTIIHKLKHHD